MEKKLNEQDIQSNWFGELLESFVPKDTNITGKTVKQLIDSASRKAFAVSSAAAIPPGFIGWSTIIPELIIVTKIQLNLVYSVAKYYGKQEQVNAIIISLIFANAFGLELGKIGVKYIFSSIN